MKSAYTSALYSTVLPTFDAVRNRWEMPDARIERMQCLFDTEMQALDFKRISLRQLEDREKHDVAEAARVEKANRERAEYLASFRGFLSDNPMKAGRQLQTLEKVFLFRGVPRTRKQIVETLIEEGRTVTENGLESAQGTFLAIGKTEGAYALHLLALRAERVAV